MKMKSGGFLVSNSITQLNDWIVWRLLRQKVDQMYMYFNDKRTLFLFFYKKGHLLFFEEYT